MVNLVFLGVLSILTYTDVKSLHIPNIIVLPAIGVGIYLTGYWLAPIAMFAFGAGFFYLKWIEGGDVKVFAMIGAFMNWQALAVVVSAWVLLYIYRESKEKKGVIPFMPFLFISSWIFFIFVN